ncbi:NAD/FAD-dependent oxidoreductase [Salinadaptatus halalkaliphilus]|uniref:NAD/FAD-dependent oxidoreductase n=1 Tax=Salinadaptatus halalkaliphilus TaxID=2419781 RepID=A0A4S3TP04_9EURY|nr:FAD-dependent oxidoreductase [Salinadaptatus halalkaliphilus]THE66054.1 NAD/FAD-dependent oxidoreductase [Salinadaptatus halalkaliphilus]
MSRIAIVGAGVAAAAASTVLEQRTDAAVTVLEKSRGLGGRAATRRRAEIVYDYGANYVKSDDERVVELLTETLETDGLVDVTEPVWTFDADGTISEGRDTDDHKWTYRAGLTQIAKRLFARTGAEIHRETRIERLERVGADGDAGRWRLADADGTTWGPFDAVLLNPPAPQSAELIRTATWEHDGRDALATAVDDVPYRTIWTGVFHYPFALERPYYALVNTDKAHEIGWLSREECKPDHVPDDESLLIVQANHEWSVDRVDDDPETTLAELAELTATLLEDDRLREPDWSDHQGWRYALPETGVDRDPLERAEREGLYCLGDWVAGDGRVHAALRNGLAVGDRVSADR